MLAAPHFQFRESITPVPDPELSSLKMQNVIARLSTTPGRIRWAGRSKGADHQEIYLERLGLNSAEIERLQASGAI